MILDGCFVEGRVTAFSLDRAARRIDQRDVLPRLVLDLLPFVRQVGIAILSEYVHQRDRPLTSVRILNQLALEEAPVIHAPQWHIGGIRGLDSRAPVEHAPRESR